MNEATKVSSGVKTGDLVFKVVTKCLWFLLAVGVAFILYRETASLFYDNLEYTSQFWVFVSGFVSFSGGTVFNWLYDEAFD